MALAAEGQYSKACAALSADVPLSATAEVVLLVKDKYPQQPPVQTAAMQAVSPAVVEQFDAAAVFDVGYGLCDLPEERLGIGHANHFVHGIQDLHFIQAFNYI